MKHPNGEISDDQKAVIKVDFREWSGGYHPGEAEDMHDLYLEQHEWMYGREKLDFFLTQWGNEEIKKERAEKQHEFAKLSFEKLNLLFHQISDAWTGEAEIIENGSDFIILRLKSDMKEVKAKLKIVQLVSELVSVENPNMATVCVSAIPSAVIAIMTR